MQILYGSLSRAFGARSNFHKSKLQFLYHTFRVAKSFPIVESLFFCEAHPICILDFISGSSLLPNERSLAPKKSLTKVEKAITREQQDLFVDLRKRTVNSLANCLWNKAQIEGHYPRAVDKKRQEQQNQF